MVESIARAYLGLGSNINPEENVPRALEALTETRGLTLAGISTIYRTAPLSDPNQPLGSLNQPALSSDPDFLNGVLEVRTVLGPEELLERLAEIERSLGRERQRSRFAPRTMDLDLLLFGRGGGPASDLQWEEIGPDGLMVHRDIERRAFVALPLMELAPDLILPPHRIPIQALAAGFLSPGGRPEEDLTRRLRERFLPS